jgi:hypothetical protein
VEFIDSSAFSGLYFDFMVLSARQSRFRVCDSFFEDVASRSVVRSFGNYSSVVIPSSIEV